MSQDRQLQEAVLANAIKVKVEQGWITLTGQVDWHFEKEAAERTVGGLFGVVGVTNLAMIKPRPDAANIGRDIDIALHRSWFSPETIKVSAQNGRVKLTGTVNTPADRRTAGSTAWSAPGTTAVENDLIILD